MTPALSVLDLVPVRTGQTSAQAVAASLGLAARADELGYARYWFAEHHNMPAVASTTPPVLAAAAAYEKVPTGSPGIPSSRESGTFDTPSPHYHDRHALPGVEDRPAVSCKNMRRRLGIAYHISSFLARSADVEDAWSRLPPA